MLRPVLVLLFASALVLPAMAQTNRSGNNTPGGIDLGGILGRVVTQTVIQAVEDAATKPKEPPVEETAPPPRPAARPAPGRRRPNTAASRCRKSGRLSMMGARSPTRTEATILKACSSSTRRTPITDEGLGASDIAARYGLEIVSRRALALGDLVSRSIAFRPK